MRKPPRKGHVPFQNSEYTDKNVRAQNDRIFEHENTQDVPTSHYSKTPVYGVLAFVALLLLLLIVYGFVHMVAPYDAFSNMKRKDNIQTIIEGVYIDDVYVGNMTLEQAQNALSTHQNTQNSALHMSVMIDGYTFYLTQNEVPFTKNTVSVLQQAYALSRQGTQETLLSNVTPFMYRNQVRDYVKEKGAYFYTAITYNETDIQKFVNLISSYVEKAPVDAYLSAFDFNTRSFAFTDEQMGKKFDHKKVHDAIISALNQKNYTAALTFEVENLLPQITKVELMNSFKKLASYTTITTSNYNRNVNIYLAAKAVHGVVLNAGDTFSFNQTTGERTKEKGYLEAAAIQSGTTIEETGGGVCQVSSTLFNTAMLSDLELVYRSPHTWPSTYVDPGRDATVNYPNLDFKFKNNTRAPIFIVTEFKQGKTMGDKASLVVEIYGVQQEDANISLETVCTKKEEPDPEPLYVRDESLDEGTQKVVKKARTGYVYDTYKVYKRGNQTYKRELLCTSVYKVIQQVIAYN